MFVNRIDKVFRDNATGHLQTGDVTIKATAHLRPRKTTGGTQLPGNETAVLRERQQNGLLDGALLRSWIFMAAIVAEVRPPVTTDEACLACKELAIDAVALRNNRALPFP